MIGEDFLGQADLEFDLANHVFRLWKPSHCGSQSLAYWTQTPEVADMRHIDVQNDIEIEVHVNGRKVDAILDSGATTSLITSAAAQAAGVREKDYSSETKDVAGLGPKVITSRVAVFDVVTIGDEQIKNAKLRVGDFFTGTSEAPIGSHIARQSLDTPQMMLGADFFRSHRVLMVNSQRRMYFTYSGGPVFQVVGDAGKPTDAAAKTPVSAAPEPAKP